MKPTIYEVLRAKLKREPTHKELCDDVRRILEEVTLPANQEENDE